MSESKVRNENYLNIQGWMRTELNLKGNNLLVFAIIYGFSQTESQEYTGGLQYLADWCGATKHGIMKNLNELISLGYIEKHEYYNNNVKYCSYIVCNSVTWGMQHSYINNIDNNKMIINTKNSINNSEEFLKSQPKQTTLVKPKKKSLYESAIDAIEEYTDNESLRKVLIEYLSIRLKMTDKKLYGVKQWQAMLNKLSTMKHQEEVVKQSIENGWASFYELKSNNSSKSSVLNLNCNAGVKCKRMTEDDYRKRDEFIEKLKKEGKQYEF